MKVIFTAYFSTLFAINFAMFAPQGMGDGLQGFTNFLLFSFFTEKFQTTLKQVFLACRRIEEPTSEASQSTVVTASQETTNNENTHLLRC